MLSAENALRASRPVPFWENQFHDDVEEQDLRA
jgi:hypothetical protein